MLMQMYSGLVKYVIKKKIEMPIIVKQALEVNTSLLNRILTTNISAVGVPTLLGYLMGLPPTTNHKMRAFLIRFLGAHSTHKLAIYDIAHVVARNFLLVDDLDGVGAFDSSTHSICQAAKLVGGEMIHPFL